MSMLLTAGLANAVCAAVLAIPALLASRYLRRPAVAHALWLLVLLKLVTPPLIQPAVSWLPAAPPEPVEEKQFEIVFDPTEGNAFVVDGREAEPCEKALAFWSLGPDFLVSAPPMRYRLVGQVKREIAPPPSRLERWLASPWLPAVAWSAGLVWVGGALLVLAAVGRKARRFDRLLRLARPAEALQARADALAPGLGMKRGPKVFLVPGLLPPLVWGFPGRVAIYFPAGLLDRLDEAERDSLLAHELAHVRRRDHWVRWLELFALALYWWFPVAWLARRQMHVHEEECCDARAVEQAPPRVYAGAILHTLDFLADASPRLPALASGLSTAAVLKQRLTLIMTGCRPGRLCWFGRLALPGLALALLPLAPRLVRAEAPAPEPPTPTTLAIIEEDPRKEELRSTRVAPVVEQAVPQPQPRQEFVFHVQAPEMHPAQGVWMLRAPHGIPPGIADAGSPFDRRTTIAVAIRKSELPPPEVAHQVYQGFAVFKPGMARTNFTRVRVIGQMPAAKD